MLLRIMLTFIFIISSALAGEVKKVVVKCSGDSKSCKYTERSFRQLQKKDLSLVELHQLLKKTMNISNFSHISYRIEANKKNYNIYVRAKIRKQLKGVELRDEIVVKKIQYKSFPSDYNPPENLPSKKGDVFLESDLRQTLSAIKNSMNQQGYLNVELDYYLRAYDGGYNLEVLLKDYKTLKIDSMNIIAPDGYFKDLLKREFLGLVGKARNVPVIKEKIQSVVDFLVYSGYKLAELNFTFRFKGRKVFATLKLELGPQFIINVKSATKIEPGLKQNLEEYIARYKREIDSNVLINASREYLSNRGYVQTKLRSKRRSYKNRFGANVVRYDIFIKDAVKSRIQRVDFDGANYFTKKFLKEIFYDEGTDLINADVYDPEYTKSFVDIIKREYYQAGFVGVLVEEPKILVKRNKMISIKYRVREGVRAKVKKINILGVNEKLKGTILKQFLNKPGTFFDPIAFEQDIEKALEVLKNNGYFGVVFENQNNKMVSYRNENSIVDITLKVKTEPKYKFRSLFIVGNIQTRAKFFQRELPLAPGELITDGILKDFHNKLLSFGLFSEIDVDLIHKKDGYADVFVKVAEKDFGAVEIALGYRTDLGIKLSTGLQYKNIDGMNKEINLTASVNQRLDTDTLDPNRSKNNASLTEYFTKFTYLERKVFQEYLWGEHLDLTFDLSNSRQRFYAFDADITKLSVLLNWNIADWVTFSTKIQQEEISQFDTTFDQDLGSFQIGSVTPGIAFDFRDNPIQTRKGAFLGFSWEVANPSLGSQNNDDLIIDYQKFTSRNRFYIPLPGGVFASSFTLGYQVNNATAKRDVPVDGVDTVGYIPNIKVFRMVGIDNVRGYEDGEINALPTGEDVSEVIINDKAYMVNIKIEPRFYLSDALMWGIFYDAGRVFLDPNDINNLRSSVGLTFKILTPVGTLDFDYGIKLLRKKDESGNLESPGRLHVSIGFF
jgi:outer membrane protein insertion porin family